MLINHQTKILGIIGNPISQSLSPLMHNAVFDKLGLDCVYLPFEIPADGTEKALQAIRLFGFKGINVTIPFKEKVLDYLDELSAEAKACQAVNCIKNDNGRLIGYNTDGKGFLAAIYEAGIHTAGQKAVMIGAGGAARSVAYNLANAGCKQMEILDINAEKAYRLAEFIHQTTDCKASARLMSAVNFAESSCDSGLIVNCSPVGMVPAIERSPIESLNKVPRDAAVCDLIYHPPVTRFLSLAQARGHKTVNGVAMFVHQGVLTLEILLGINPPAAFMKDVVSHYLEGKRYNSN